MQSIAVCFRLNVVVYFFISLWSYILKISLNKMRVLWLLGNSIWLMIYYSKSFFFLKERNYLIWQECIKLIDRDSQDMYTVTKDLGNTLV